MIPELSLFCLIFAFGLSIMLGVLPLAGTYLQEPRWMRLSVPLTLMLCVLVLLSFVGLTLSFVGDDFSVAYVAANSNTRLPVYYKISAVWSAHEGSLLLWALILSLWMSAVALFSRSLPWVLRARVLSILGLLAVGFIAFILFTSSPFARNLPFYPSEGRDLNPLLQDFGLIVHPPLLYCGYVGFAVPFAFAVAVLLGLGEGALDANGTRWMRPWANIAWAFLTIGIALGSWWAYYELGWGGWWFWDPVENASFMPWLAGTALLHSLAATEKRKVFVSWTLLLAIFAFSLSLLGTFLVRSGVLTSVHAFATDPTRGYFILAFLAVVIGGSLTLYAVRAPTLAKSDYSFLSREMFILLNSCLMVIILAVVCLGTLYPLISDAMNWGKISVGPPYFDRFFIPLMGVAVLIMPVGAVLNWSGNSKARALIHWLARPAAVAAFLAPLLLMALSLPVTLAGLAGAWLGLWVMAVSAADLLQKTRNARSFLMAISVLRPAYWGMWLAHIGMAVTAMGIVFTSLHTEQREMRLAPGEDTKLGAYHFRFEMMEDSAGANYVSQRALFSIGKAGSEIEMVYAEKRRHFGDRVMTEAGIAPGFTRDLYVSLGEALQPDLGNKSAWSVRIHIKPAVRWIWLGALLMAAGGLLAVWDKRYRKVGL